MSLSEHSFERLTGGIEPDCVETTKHRVIKTWFVDHCEVVSTLDKDSGLVIYNKKEKNKPKSPNKRMLASDFMMVFDKVGEARGTGELTYDEVAVLHGLIERIGWENNYVCNSMGGRMSCRQVAEYIGKSYNWTLNVLKSLEWKNFIRIETSNRGSSIYVRACYAWRGKLEAKSRAPN
jgi:hypothetical protein